MRSKAHDREVGPFPEQVLHARTRGVAGRPGPPDDVLVVGQDGPQRRLHVAVPEHLTSPSATDGPTDDLAHHDPRGEVEPHRQVRATGQQRPGSVVLPLGHPRRPGRELGDIGVEFRSREPFRPVVQFVDLDVPDSEGHGDPRGQGRLPRPGGPGDEDAAGSRRQAVVEREHGHGHGVWQPASGRPPGHVDLVGTTDPAYPRITGRVVGNSSHRAGAALFGAPSRAPEEAGMSDLAAGPQQASGGTIRSLIPARIDRLNWAPFHTRMVLALGTAWVLDGIEITIAGAIAAVLTEKATLGLSSTQAGAIATVYLLGEVFGALVFGRLSDALGRKNLFVVTLGVYLAGNALTAFTWGNGTLPLVFLYLTRFIAGSGIGGEYAAINSAIDEMMPAKYRGRVDIAVNGTYWAGSIVGTLGTFVLLHQMSLGIGWRLGFLIGPILGACIWNLRRHLPESPRWLIMHGREQEAEDSIAIIEREVQSSGRHLAPIDENKAIEITPSPAYGYLTLAKVLFSHYPSRSTLAAVLMISQSFLYNAIFFTYTLVLTKFYHVPAANAPIYLIAFAAGNLIGPLTIGHLFDSLGRRKMISGTYMLSGILLAITAVMFDHGVLNPVTQTLAWCVIFFFASAGASAAYLTASELFPLEVRAQAIAVFFAIAQCFGAVGPIFYGWLIGDGGDPGKLFVGYLIGAGIMIVGGIVDVFLGVDAEGKSLEEVAPPLAAVSATRPRATG
jgi:MFS family permease